MISWWYLGINSEDRAAGMAQRKQTQRSKVEAKGEGLLICTGEWLARGAKRGNSSPSVWNGSGIEEALNQTDAQSR